MKTNLLIFVILLLTPLMGRAAPRPILVCVADQTSPAIRRAAEALVAGPDGIPLVHALRAAGEAGDISLLMSDRLLAPNVYDTAAHSHLIVIGLRSSDPLLSKTWGTTVSIDETTKQIYTLGFGHLAGDIGWVESDRNPFLHSRRIKSAPEGTVIVKITGTNETGVLAAIEAFKNGFLNGLVPAGSVKRHETTLLDRDPSADPAPVTLPASLSIKAASATLAGWTQVPENEYRAVLETSNAMPQRMWRYKYLAADILKEEPLSRWYGGVNRMAMGNTVALLEFTSDEEALSAARNMTSKGFTTRFGAGRPDQVWEAPWPFRQNKTDSKKSMGKTIVTARGRYVVASTLPYEATLEVAASIH